MSSVESGSAAGSQVVFKKINNKITEDYFKAVKDLQENLFQEIKSKIKLNDTICS